MGLGRSLAAIIFRREDRKFLGASVLVMAGAFDPSIVEAITCREAFVLLRMKVPVP